MLMRYYWGLGVGHIYSHLHPSHSIHAELIELEDTSEEQPNDPDLRPVEIMEWDDDNERGGPMEVEDPELGLEEHDKEPELEWDTESELDELCDMVETSDEELELYSTYEVDF